MSKSFYCQEVPHLVRQNSFLQRERKFPDEHFYRTHAQSRKTLLQLAMSDLDVEIALYENDLTEKGLTFYE